MKIKLLNIILFTVGAFIFSSILTNTKIFAKTCTWNGSQSGEWSNQNNWDIDCLGMEPQNGDDLVFPATATTYVMNNFATATHFGSFNFYSGSYTVLHTNPAGISNGIYTHGTKPSIATDLTLDSDLIIESALIQNLDLNGHDLTLDSSGGEVQISSPITGTGNITVTGGGIVNTEGWNTFIGTLDVKNNTTLKFFHTAGLSDSAPTIEGGSTLYYTGPGNLTVTNDINFGDNSTLKSDGDLNVFSGALTSTGVLKVEIADGTSTTLSGTLNVLSIQKQGLGQLVLSGNTDNTMGGAIILQGDLLLNKNSAIAVQGEIDINGDTNTSSLTNGASNQIDNSASVHVSGANGTWNLNGFNETVGSVYTLDGDVTTSDGNLVASTIIMDGGTIDSGTGSTTLLGANIALDALGTLPSTINGHLSFTQDVLIQRLSPLAPANPLVINAQIDSANSITVEGIDVTLSAANSSFTGAMVVGQASTINTTILRVSNTLALGPSLSSTTTIYDKSTVLLDSGTYNESFVVGSNGMGSYSGQTYGAITVDGINKNVEIVPDITLTAASTFSVLGGNTTLNLGTINGNYDLTLQGPAVVAPPGVLVNFTAASTRAALTTVNNMILGLMHLNAINSLSDVYLNNGAALSIGYDQTLGAVLGSGSVSMNSAGLTLTITQVGTKSFDGYFVGNGNIKKDSTDANSKYILTGDNSATYNGLIQIINGGVIINNDFSGATVDVHGGFLGGNGTVGIVISTSGTIAPGNSPGIITINNDLTLNSSMNLTMEITGALPGTGYDQINVIGNVDLGGATLTLIVDPSFNPQVGSQLHLITATGTITGTYGNMAEGTKITSNNVVYQIHYTSNGVVLTVLSNSLANTGADIPVVPAIAFMVASLVGIVGILVKYKKSSK